MGFKNNTKRPKKPPEGPKIKHEHIGKTFFLKVLSGGMQWLFIIPLFLIYSASMFPEVFVPLDIQLYKVADFDRINFPSATVADLKYKNEIKYSA